MIVEKKEPASYYRVRCGESAYSQVAEIANECDLTIKQVVDALLLYALNHSEIVSTEKIVTENRLVIGGEDEYQNQ